MRHLLLDPKEIDSERQVVMEERRTRTEDDPDGLARRGDESLAFKAHPYRWPVIGWMEDIRRIDSGGAARVLRHLLPAQQRHPRRGGRRRGARDPGGASAACSDGIARGPDPPPVAAVEPPQIDERRVLVKKPGAQLPIVDARLARAELPVGGRAGARSALHHPVRGTRLAPLPEARLRAAPRARRGRGLLVLLARSEPVLRSTRRRCRARRPRRSSRRSSPRSSW